MITNIPLYSWLWYFVKLHHPQRRCMTGIFFCLHGYPRHHNFKINIIIVCSWWHIILNKIFYLISQENIYLIGNLFTIKDKDFESFLTSMGVNKFYKTCSLILAIHYFLSRVKRAENFFPKLCPWHLKRTIHVFQLPHNK